MACGGGDGVGNGGSGAGGGEGGRGEGSGDGGLVYSVLSADAPVGAPPEGNAKEVTRRRRRMTTTVSSSDEIMATGSLPAVLSLPAAICSGCANLTPPCATALLDLRCTLGVLQAYSRLCSYTSAAKIARSPFSPSSHARRLSSEPTTHWRSQAGAARWGACMDQPLRQNLYVLDAGCSQRGGRRTHRGAQRQSRRRARGNSDADSRRPTPPSCPHAAPQPLRA